MKKLPVALFIAFVFGISTLAAAAEVEDFSSTIKDFRGSPAVAEFFNHNYGYAVFPTIGKAGYIIGGSYGKGQVYRGGKVTGKTTVIEGSIGFQAGGEAFSEIIFFQDQKAYSQFISGNFEFGATAQAAVITAGATAKAGTGGASAGAGTGMQKGVQAKTGYVLGMATFVITKGGFMYELSLGGQKFTYQPL